MAKPPMLGPRAAFANDDLGVDEGLEILRGAFGDELRLGEVEVVQVDGESPGELTPIGRKGVEPCGDHRLHGGWQGDRVALR